MNISVNKLLDKLGRELQSAKEAGTETKIRKHAYAMKALCELILEEPLEVSRSVTPQPPAPFQQQSVTLEPPQKRLETEDGANGDSLFDF